MLMLSIDGWLDGFTAFIVIISYSAVGFFLIYESRKTNARLLLLLGLSILAFGFWNLYPLVDFIIIILTGTNAEFLIMTDSIQFFFINMALATIWAPLAGMLFVYIVTELLIPKIKWVINSIYFLIAFLFELSLLIDIEGNYQQFHPSTPGQELITGDITFGSIASILMIILLGFVLIFNVIGTFIKGIQSEGVIKKKFFDLSLGWLLTFISTILETALRVPLEEATGLSLSFITVISRVVMILGIWIIYLAIREEPEEPKVIELKKEVKVESSLFRLTKRPSHITEEEVMFHKEQKICLVCKNSVSGYNVFICPSCDALYCQNCARALEELENTCWVCNRPIDPSKPVKLVKKEDLDVKLVDEMQKKDNTS